jgi:hypothetical protein
MASKYHVWLFASGRCVAAEAREFVPDTQQAGPLDSTVVFRASGNVLKQKLTLILRPSLSPEPVRCVMLSGATVYY